jgi:DNA gyrase subunit B
VNKLACPVDEALPKKLRKSTLRMELPDNLRQGMNLRHMPLELHDCQEHTPGSGAELYIVEGDSAAKSVCRLRSRQLQAVIAMQGKPLNAYKAKADAVTKYKLYHTLLQSLGCTSLAAPEKLRYDRIIFLFDPDADGIHIGALMLLFFYRWLRPVIENGKLFVVRAPLYEIANVDRSQIHLGYTEEQYRQLCAQLGPSTDLKKQRYRGLGSMNEDVLYRTCISTETRILHRLTVADAEASRLIFGGKIEY